MQIKRAWMDVQKGHYDVQINEVDDGKGGKLKSG